MQGSAGGRNSGCGRSFCTGPTATEDQQSLSASFQLTVFYSTLMRKIVQTGVCAGGVSLAERQGSSVLALSLVHRCLGNRNKSVLLQGRLRLQHGGRIGNPIQAEVVVEP